MPRLNISGGLPIFAASNSSLQRSARVKHDGKNYVERKIQNAYQGDTDFGNFFVAVEIQKPQQQRVKCLTDYAEGIAGDVVLQDKCRVIFCDEKKRQFRTPEEKSCRND